MRHSSPFCFFPPAPGTAATGQHIRRRVPVISEKGVDGQRAQSFWFDGHELHRARLSLRRPRAGTQCHARCVAGPRSPTSGKLGLQPTALRARLRRAPRVEGNAVDGNRAHDRNSRAPARMRQHCVCSLTKLSSPCSARSFALGLGSATTRLATRSYPALGNWWEMVRAAQSASTLLLDSGLLPRRVGNLRSAFRLSPEIDAAVEALRAKRLAPRDRSL